MQALALVEHVDRELDLLCLLKALLKSRHGIELKIANFYADAPLLLSRPAPRLVLTPFFYAAEDVVLKDYVEGWPETRFLNLAWEQLFYPSHQQIKAPRDRFTRKQVTHLAWTHAFVAYLEAHGVMPRMTRLVGQGMYRLYGPPYRDYFAGRAEMAAAFALDAGKRWVFAPENYRWAFFSDFKLKRLTKLGVEYDEMLRMRDYCRRSMGELVAWCQALAASGDTEVIFRPRPATSVAELTDFVAEALGGQAPLFRIVKDRSAREWVLSSDMVASSYSTVLIEAALAEKAILRVAPEPTPQGLRYDWCELAPEAVDQAAFLDACRRADPASGDRLRQWAEETFFPAGDPVERLVETIAEEVRAAHAGLEAPATAAHGLGMPAWLAPVAALASPQTRHELFEKHVPNYAFNRSTHEKDLFAASEVDRRTRRWRRLVLERKAMAPA